MGRSVNATPKRLLFVRKHTYDVQIDLITYTILKVWLFKQKIQDGTAAILNFNESSDKHKVYCRMTSYIYLPYFLVQLSLIVTEIMAMACLGIYGSGSSDLLEYSVVKV